MELQDCNQNSLIDLFLLSTLLTLFIAHQIVINTFIGCKVFHFIPTPFVMLDNGCDKAKMKGDVKEGPLGFSTKY